MFARATKAFLEDTDPGGCLIPATSQLQSKHLEIYSLMFKKPIYLFKKNNRYGPLQFTLSSVLKTKVPEDTFSKMVIKAADEVVWKKTRDNQNHCSVDGKIETVVADGGAKLEGNSSTKDYFKFQTIREHVDMKEFPRYCQNLELDMGHPVIKQAKKHSDPLMFLKTRASLGVLTERILTSTTCVLTSNNLISGGASGNVQTKINPCVKATVNQNVSGNRNNNSTMKICENTVVAYRVNELKIKPSGKFCMLLLPGKQNGGFVEECDKDGEASVAHTPPNLIQELEDLASTFDLLSELKDSNLFHTLKKTMKDREAVSFLEEVLDRLCENPDRDDLNKSERAALEDIVTLLVDDSNEPYSLDTRSSILHNIHLIVSAIDEMTEDCISTLLSLSHPDKLNVLRILVHQMAAESGEPVSFSDADLAALTEVYGKVEHLFDQCDFAFSETKRKTKGLITPYPHQGYSIKKDQHQEEEDAADSLAVGERPNKMFARATKAFLEDTDPGGCLIPATSQLQSKHLEMYSLIFKRPKFFFKKQNKYELYQFTLRSVLKTKDPEDTFSEMVINDADKIHWTKTRDNENNCIVDKKIETVVADGGAKLESNSSTKDYFKFQTIGEHVDMDRFLDYCQNKELDMGHPVIKQAKKHSDPLMFLKTRASLGVLTERILTSTTCVLTSNNLISGGASGNVQTKINPCVKATVNANVSGIRNSNSSMKICENTVLAYRVNELKIKPSGKFSMLLLPSNQNGGFVEEYEDDDDDAHTPPTLIEGMLLLPSNQNWGFGKECDDDGEASVARTQPTLIEELENLDSTFDLLSGLKDSNLFHTLRTTMEDREAVSFLEKVLDRLCENPDQDDLDKSERAALEDIVTLLKGISLDTRSSILHSIHFIVSAIDEMTEDCISTLLSLSHPDKLNVLRILVHQMAAESGEPVSFSDADLAALTEVYGKVEHLFDQCDVTLTKCGNKLTAKIKDQSGNLPLVLGIAVNGLGSLV
ncbi:hypothetical protein DPEC_G00229780 [Dallia pectoralis]|uniref:Uncharacterized protein n=1 Tax=Dallia pectoralis TaxID=75939 RepID=A0ACC2G1P0_DALPE|nr:hypothetical protein DPEC_G00229780 [Dallia pectoralis]